MSLIETINNFVLNKTSIPSNIKFFKTEIVSIIPYKTKLIDSYHITSENLIEIYNEIINNKVNIEYSVCLNDCLPSYDNKTEGYRLTYTITNNLNVFDSTIFSLLGTFCEINLDSEKDLKPLEVMFILGLLLFTINDTNEIQNTVLKTIESISFLKKEKKTNIVFQTTYCDDVEELENAIKRVFVFKPTSLFTKKKFNK